MMGGIKSFVNCVTSVETLLLFLKVSVQYLMKNMLCVLSAWPLDFYLQSMFKVLHLIDR